MEIRTLDDARAWVAEHRGRMSQAKLATHLGVRQSTVGNWESERQPAEWPLGAWLKTVQLLGHKVEVAPAGGRREKLLARLRDASDRLSDTDLERLATVAENLSGAPEDVRALISNLLGTLATQR